MSSFYCCICMERGEVDKIFKGVDAYIQALKQKQLTSIDGNFICAIHIKEYLEEKSNNMSTVLKYIEKI